MLNFYILNFILLSMSMNIVMPFVIDNSTNSTVVETSGQQDSHSLYYDYDANKINGHPIRGVNIGGWLLLEPYITPSLFEAFRTNPNNDNGIPVDEYHFCQYLGFDEAKKRLERHWSTFYQESDFANIASNGFNLVRIPIGYWAFSKLDTDPYITGIQESYLDNAIQWAKKYNLKVWIDLHGAAGSQNGFDNSGLRDAYNFLDDSNLSVTRKALNYIMSKYSQDEYLSTVIGIELLNEPLGPVIDMNKLKNNFLMPSYNYVRYELSTNQVIIIHDSFQAYHYWDNFMTVEQGFWGVVVDHHHYQVFSPGELSRPLDVKIKTACGLGYSMKNEYHWTIMGEFSGALTDCTKWLNGVGRGARYDGSFFVDNPQLHRLGSCANNDDISHWSKHRKENTRKFIEAQLDAFEMRDGWIFWCYKTEDSIEWDAGKLIKYGIFPQPLTSRKYPDQCNIM
ncbi:hypothetical protein Kpol_1009p16 [Vanderwaltozyma polyspora DSM 70294]|uniref:glucan 1,3-beta-glucosidase n=1 Tax=Vanderwaltozyma polyspora (strain ATCC 22028 / DSM 70294 / BCRC 21397 / CBS 2163 / NBRC 10782 / NRRL Y-8283 / UCD 57-17) TaxID=436907 RepID=A7TPE2_VANPO|nr:uncharacterized protein Kpol_1009p16 [Vanderwaltozyma polyspora DSM 70294]EDO15870.1 hypothetical protein Kpol_1009p16 [Vanderwaltozyma polyspora DSM 70294]